MGLRTNLDPLQAGAESSPAAAWNAQVKTPPDTSNMPAAPAPAPVPAEAMGPPAPAAAPDGLDTSDLTPLDTSDLTPVDTSDLTPVAAPPPPKPKNDSITQNYIASAASKLVSWANLTQGKISVMDGPSSIGPDGKPVPHWQPKNAETFTEYVKAVYGGSTIGMLANESLPEYVVPETAPFAVQLATELSGAIAELPVMVVGGLVGTGAGEVAGGAAGAAAGSVVPGVGTATVGAAGALAGGMAGGLFGAFTAPAMLRQAVLDHYTNGDIQTWNEFNARMGAQAIAGMHGTVGGLVPFGAGKLAGGAAGKVTKNVVAKTTAQLGAEIAAMAKVNAALEGKVADWKDWVHAGVTVLGLHGASALGRKTVGAVGAGSPELAGKAMGPEEPMGPPAPGVRSPEEMVAEKGLKAWAKTGLNQEQILEYAVKDPMVLQELVSLDNQHMRTLDPYVNTQSPGEFTLVKGKLVPTEEAPIETQGKFDFTPQSAIEELGIGRSTEAQRLEAARAVDPEAYKAGDKMEADIKSHRSEIEANKAEIEKLVEQERSIRQELLAGAGTEKTEKSRTRQSKKIEGLANKVKSLLNKNKVLEDRLARIESNSEIPARMAEAYQKGIQTLNRAAKNRLTNMRIVVPEAQEMVRPYQEGIGLEDSLPEVPELSPTAAEQLILASDQGELFADKTPTSGAEGMRDIPAPETGVGIDDPYMASAITGLPITHFVRYETDIASPHLLEHPELQTRFAEKPAAKEKSKGNIDIEDKDFAVVDEMFFENDLASKIHRTATLFKKWMTSGRMYQDYVDRLAPLKKISQYTYDVAEQAGYYGAMRKHFITEGTLDYKTGKANGESLFKVMNEVGWENSEKFETYWGALRDNENMSKGLIDRLNTPEKRAARDRVIEKGDAAGWRPLVERAVDWVNRSEKYVADAHGIPESEFNAMIGENKYYFRISVEAEDGVPRSKAGSRTKSLFQKMTGSERRMERPLIATLERFNTHMKMAMENTAKLEAIRALREKGEILGDVVVSEKELLDGDSKDASGVTIETRSKYEKAQSMVGKDQVVFWEDGKVKIAKDIDPDIAAALNNMNMTSAPMGVLGKVAAGMAQAKRVSLALNPGWIARHISREVVSAGFHAQPRNGAAYNILPVEIFRLVRDGMLQWKGKTEIWKQAEALTDLGSSYEMINDHFIKNNVYGAYEGKGVIGTIGKIPGVVRHPVHAAHAVATFLNKLAIAGEYAKRLPKNATKEQQVMTAARARDLFAVSQRHGLKTAAARRYIPYMLDAIAGMDKTVKAAKGDPKKYVAMGAQLAAFTAATYWWNHFIMQDERMDQQTERDKQLFTAISLGKDVPLLKIANSYGEGQLFQSTTRLFLDRLRGDKHAFDDWGKNFAQDFLPNVTPTIGEFAIENIGGTSLYSNLPITPDSIEGLPVSARATEYTTETAKMMSAIIGKFGFTDAKWRAPTMMDHNIQSLMGTPGEIMRRMLDKALLANGFSAQDIDPLAAPSTKNKPTLPVEDWPMIRDFISHQNLSSEQVVRFGKQYRAQAALEQLVKLNAERGKADAVAPILAMYAPKLTGIKATIDTIRKDIRRIYYVEDAPGFKAPTPDEKAQLIGQLKQLIIRSAQEGNKIYDELKEQMGADRARLEEIENKTAKTPEEEENRSSGIPAGNEGN